MLVEYAIKSDAQRLTEITFQSKAHWGYSPEQMEQWREELTISEVYIEKNEVYKLVVKDDIVAYYAYIALEEDVVELDNIFVIPTSIGLGYGKHLMDDFTKRVKEEGFKTIRLYADPNAEIFYSKLGFKIVGQKQSSLKNRFLPIMEKAI